VFFFKSETQKLKINKENTISEWIKMEKYFLNYFDLDSFYQITIK